MSLKVEVVPILDSQTYGTNNFKNLKIYNEVIPEEIKPDEQAECFLGAWYRKVYSSTDKWLGIEGVIELGEFTPDENRFNLDGKGRYMDVPSIYMGGKSDLESDAGLGLNTSYLSSDTSVKLDYSSPKLAYRPFWRYIYKDVQDVDGNVTRREINSWNVTDPKSLMYYYFPGDVLRISVFSPVTDYLQLRIEVIKATNIKKYQDVRRKYNLVNDLPSDFYSPIFHSKGHGDKLAEFKRVNAIDQFGNEGFNANNTKATVSTATWSEVYLYREVNGEIVKVPFDKKRQTRMICPNEKAISVEIDEINGTEKIQIHPDKIFDR